MGGDESFNQRNDNCLSCQHRNKVKCLTFRIHGCREKTLSSRLSILLSYLFLFSMASFVCCILLIIEICLSTILEYDIMETCDLF